MEKKEKMTIEKEAKKGTLVYTYLFNYFGKNKFDKKTITGAAIDLAIKVIKDNEAIEFTEEINISGRYLSDIYTVSYDREKCYQITENPQIKDLIKTGLKADNIEYSIVGYSLDYLSGFGLGEEIEKDLPIEIRNMPVSKPMEVTKDEFEKFLGANVDEFDISDNRHAQVPSYSIIDTPHA